MSVKTVNLSASSSLPEIICASQSGKEEKGRQIRDCKAIKKIFDNGSTKKNPPYLSANTHPGICTSIWYSLIPSSSCCIEFSFPHVFFLPFCLLLWNEGFLYILYNILLLSIWNMTMEVSEMKKKEPNYVLLVLCLFFLFIFFILLYRHMNVNENCEIHACRAIKKRRI